MGYVLGTTKTNMTTHLSLFKEGRPFRSFNNTKELSWQEKSDLQSVDLSSGVW